MNAACAVSEVSIGGKVALSSGKSCKSVNAEVRRDDSAILIA